MIDLLKYTIMSRNMTYKDYGCLINLITDNLHKVDVSPDDLHALYLVAVNSKKYNSTNIPGNIVTLNSEILLTDEKKQRQKVRIVLPIDIKNKNDKSVYCPLGIACLGKKEKDFVYVKQKNGIKKLQIEKIEFQPEKANITYL